LAYQISNNCKAMLLPDSLHKILGNLLSNAVKYSDCGATVTIESHSNQQGDCEIKINNRPTVIAPKQLSLIFNRFYRINNQESERETGSGLGLSIVKELIEANNCHISVESNATIGTSFTVTIPCKIIANNQANSAEIEPNQQSTESTKFSSTDNKSHAKTNKQSVNLPTIFVVEDNPDLNSFLCDLLSNDYLCISAKNGKEAFEQIKKTLPDLILSDILMPELDGLSLCKRLKSESTTSQIPVILLTARDDDETRNKGWENLADALLTKPFKSKELLLRINNLIANRQIVKNLQSNEISQSRQLNEHEHASLAKLDRKFLTKLDRFIENNYQSCTLNVDKIASHMAMSERQLQRKLKALTGHSINDYLKQHRLICAAQYLKDGHRVTEVTDMVGFSSSAYFSKCFKEFYQMTPKNYQKSYKDA
jgi:DNA-binding response OmpR family regulator/acetyltransferase-like isoleucine patch superfamily enzyme